MTAKVVVLLIKSKPVSRQKDEAMFSDRTLILNVKGLLSINRPRYNYMGNWAEIKFLPLTFKTITKDVECNDAKYKNR